MDELQQLKQENELLKKALYNIAFRSVAEDDLQWCRRIAREALNSQVQNEILRPSRRGHG